MGGKASVLAPTTLCCFWEALRADRMRRVRHEMEEEPHSPGLLVSEIRVSPAPPPLLQPGKTGQQRPTAEVDPVHKCMKCGGCSQASLADPQCKTGRKISKLFQEALKPLLAVVLCYSSDRH